MKNKYFTPETIGDESQKMLDSVSEYNRKDRIIYIKENSALIILDMQQYFLDESSHAYIPSAPAIIPGLKLLIDAYSRNNYPVIFTRHINSDENTGLMKKWWNIRLLSSRQ